MCVVGRRHFSRITSLIRNTKVSTCVTLVLIITIIAHFFSLAIYINYPHIPLESIPNELYRKTVPGLPKRELECDYNEILSSNVHRKHLRDIQSYVNFYLDDVSNGTFVPMCVPQFSVAILVTYKNRKDQLEVFLPYMHNFLRKQNIHYRIYLIEQRDNKTFNKGMLYNIGAKRAIADKFPCLIMHDVDLLPLDDNNLYACSLWPRHMSACIDKYRYLLPYEGLIGGVLAIRSLQYEMVNGLSNRYEGWGGEDDDMLNRLHASSLHVVRYPPSMSRYSMLVHHQEPRNEARFLIRAENKAVGSAFDGYRNLLYHTIEVQPHRLFMLIIVKL